MLASIIAMAWWTSFLRLVTCRVSFCSRFMLHRFFTAAAYPGHGLLGVLVGCCRQEALLFGLVLATGGAAAFVFAFFLDLVLCASASVSTGAAARAAAFWLDRTCCFYFNFGWLLYCGGSAVATLRNV